MTAKTAAQMIQEARQRVQNLTVEEVAEELAKGSVTLVDVREQAEWEAGMIPGAIHASARPARGRGRPDAPCPSQGTRSPPACADLLRHGRPIGTVGRHAAEHGVHERRAPGRWHQGLGGIWPPGRQALTRSSIVAQHYTGSAGARGDGRGRADRARGMAHRRAESRPVDRARHQHLRLGRTASIGDRSGPGGSSAPRANPRACRRQRSIASSARTRTPITHPAQPCSPRVPARSCSACRRRTSTTTRTRPTCPDVC